MPAFDAVDGSSTGHVSAMDMGATKAPMIRRSYLCKQLRCRRSVRHENGIFRQQTERIAAAILAQCGTWKMWVDDNLCTLHGSNPGVTAGMSCGLYVRGDQGVRESTSLAGRNKAMGAKKHLVLGSLSYIGPPQEKNQLPLENRCN